jgi:aminoglycoside phosphotransferase (APT) family kinase protein
MRTNIYYWKCDNPLPVEEKLVYNDKYKLADITDVVKDIAVKEFRKVPIKIISTGSSGNHYAYHIVYKNKTYFFRSDDGKIDDDYMDAEKVAIDLARKSGVSVPQIFATDTSKKYFPVRYQIMEKVDGESMKEFYQKGTMDRNKTSTQLGSELAKMHKVKLEKYGFLNTKLIRDKNTVEGLDDTNEQYFNKKLNDHLEYLGKTNFLTLKEVEDINKLIDINRKYLGIEKGHLVHKDIAFWNMIGTPTKINAIVDWDDVISGDPVDDLAVVRCFYDEDVFDPLIKSYFSNDNMPENFYPRLWLYMIRNMLWKAVFRSFMQYFDFKEKVNLLMKSDENKSLKQFTYEKLYFAVDKLRKVS